MNDSDVQYRERFSRVNALLIACTPQKGTDEIGSRLEFMMDGAIFPVTAE